MVIFVKNLRLLWDGKRVKENVNVLIDESGLKVEEVDKSDVVIDGEKLAIIPSFANMHTHLAMIVLRGYHDDSELNEWLQKIWKIEDRMTPEVIYYASILGLYEMVKTGTTLFVDMYFYPEETVRALKLFGVKGALGYPILDDGKLEERFRNAEKFIKKYKGDENVLPIVNVHAIYTASLNTIERAKDLAREYDVYYNIHASETRWELVYSLKKYGKTPVEAMQSVLDEKTILAHGTWITKREIDLISRSSSLVVHNATSNMKLAGGSTMPLRELVSKDCLVALGTDGASSNNSYDMFIEMKIACLLQKHHYWDPLACKSEDVLKMATINGFSFLNQNPGWTGIDLSNIRMFPVRKYNFFSNLVYSCTGDCVKLVISDGKIIYNERFPERIEKEREKAEKKLYEFLDENVET